MAWGSAAVTVFLLGAVYLGLRGLPDAATFSLMGGDEVRAGTTAAFRISALPVDGGRALPVEIRQVTVGGAPVNVEVNGSLPALVTIPIAAGLTGSAKIAFHVVARGHKDTLEKVVSVRSGPGERGRFEAASAKLQEIKSPHRLDVIPEGGAVALGMSNRVFVHVRTPDGKPAAGTSVVVRHARLPGGAVQSAADTSGLLVFTIDADQPTFRFGLTATGAGADPTAVTEAEELVRAFGRKMLLHTDAAVVPPGVEVTATLALWRPDTVVYCDLVESQAVLRVWRLHVTEPEYELKLPGLGPGTYRVQCTDHPFSPGETWATTPLLVTDEPPLKALQAAVARRGLVHKAAFVEPAAADLPLALAYWTARLRDAPMAPSLLVATRQEAVARLQANRREKKTFILGAIAVVFLIALLLVAEAVLRNVRETRAGLRAVEAEIEALDTEIMADGELRPVGQLSSSRGILVAGFLGLTLLLNVIAVIWLLAMIR